MPEDSLKRSRSPENDNDIPNKRPYKSSSSSTITSSKQEGTSSQNDPIMSLTSDSSTAITEGASTAAPPSDATLQQSGEAGAAAPPVPAQSIHMRCLIVTTDASVIIGRGGTHVNEIREKSGAKIVVSESIPGNPERILNVNGPLDAVSKAFGLIVRRINDEPYDKPSVPGSKAVTIKFIIPNSRMGSVIGKQGSKIKEIQEASGAKLNASEGMLPGSTERVLSISGVADAIHIATYYVGNILIEAGSNASSSVNSTYRPGSSSRGPRAAHDRTSSFNGRSSSMSHNSYAPPPPGAHPSMVPPAMLPDPNAQLHTQYIYIPNDLVGCIIGKGGSKINEIRASSQSTIKIMEPGSGNTPPPAGATPAAPGERLVTITGTQRNVAIAVQLLYQRLETERKRLSTKGQPA